MTEFEDRLSELRDAWRYRSTDEDVPAIGALAVAEGLSELIALLRPLVETVTAKPEPLVLRSTNVPIPCLAGDPGSNGFRRCMEPYGHDGDHRHRSNMHPGVEYVWTQRHGDVPPARPTVCGAEGPRKDHGAFGVRQYVCQLPGGHDGKHSCGGPSGNTETWGGTTWTE